MCNTLDPRLRGDDDFLVGRGDDDFLMSHGDDGLMSLWDDGALMSRGSDEFKSVSDKCCSLLLERSCSNQS